MAYANSEGSDRPAHPRSQLRAFAANTLHQGVYIERNERSVWTAWFGVLVRAFTVRNCVRQVSAWRDSHGLTYTIFNV